MKRFLANILMGDCLLTKNFLQPVFNFGLRFYVAYVFFKSGLGKVDDNFQVTQTTIDMFADDFKVPFLPADIAAYLAAYAELILPVLLVLGFLTRPAALALFILNAVALFSLHTAGWANPVGNWQHVIWGVLLLTIFVYGPSKLSIDSWLSDTWRDDESNLLLKLIGIIVFSGICYFLLNTYL